MESAAKGTHSVTLKEVAARAGLSASAASLALSGNERIPEATRERVRTAASALGYQPNGAARALRTQRHQAIALLTFGPGAHESLSFYSEAVVAVADEALRQGYAVMLVNARSSTGSGQTVTQTLRNARVDGAVCIGTHVTVDDVQALRRRDFPFIFIGKRELPSVHIPYVATDYLAAARMATAHLLRQGHRRVAVAVDPDERDLPWIRDRLAGHALALREEGLADDAGPLIEVPPDGPGPDVVASWCDQGISAIFAASYRVSERLLHALHRDRVPVPDQMAIAAFDDESGAALAVPPLTCVRQPLAALGAMAARSLLAWLDGAPQEPLIATLPASLIIRRSCGARMGDERFKRSSILVPFSAAGDALHEESTAWRKK